LTVAFTAKLVPILQEQEETVFEEKPVFGYIIFIFLVIFLIFAIYFFYVFFQEPIKHPKHSFRVSTTHIIVFIIILLLSYFMGSKGTIPEEQIIENESSEKYEDKTMIPGDIEDIEEGAKTKTIPIEIFLILGVILICLFFFKIPQKNEAQKDETVLKEKISHEEWKNEAVVEYYKKAVLLLNKKGIPYKDSFTHWELENIVEKKEKEEIINSFAELTILFEKCKYSTKNINENDVNKAIEMYEKILQIMER